MSRMFPPPSKYGYIATLFGRCREAMPDEIGFADVLPEEIEAEQEIIQSFEPLRVGDLVELRWKGKLITRHVLGIRAFSVGLEEPHARMLFPSDRGTPFIPVYFLDTPGLWFRRRVLKKLGGFTL